MLLTLQSTWTKADALDLLLNGIGGERRGNVADRTSIEWCDASWPVVRGCTKCSPGCDNCWSIQDAHLHAGNPNAKARAHFEGLTQIQNGRPNWTGEVRIDKSILNAPSHWRKDRRIFVASSGDLFHESLSFQQIAAVWAAMGSSFGRHTYLILTKRAQRMFEFHQWLDNEPNDPNWEEYYELRLRNGGPGAGTTRNWIRELFRNDSHFWIGVSVEDEKRARLRLPWLLKTPAAVRWVSYEPALGPVNWNPYLTPVFRATLPQGTPKLETLQALCDVARAAARTEGQNFLDWIVVGGESGRGARPFDLDWARQTITQCKHAGVPCFVKQLGARPATVLEGKQLFGTWKDRKGGNIEEWPEWARVRQYPRVTP